MGQSDRDETLADLPSTTEETRDWATPRIGRRTPLPSNRACGTSGVLAGILNGVMLLKGGQPFIRALIGALFVGVFVYGGMRFVTATRRRIRPDITEANNSEIDAYPQAQSRPTGAPTGGWANPTRAQKFARRIARITSNYGKRRPPRR
jgi:hypothetical protein